MSNPKSYITQVACLLLLLVAPSLAAGNDGANQTTKPSLAVAQTTVAPVAVASVNPTLAAALPATTDVVKPQVVSTPTTADTASLTAKVNQTLMNLIKSAPPIAPKPVPVKGESKFALYFKPICDSLDKIQPKQFFKVQSELKQFVHLTNAKLAVCFFESYKIDPGVKPIEKADVSLICASRNAASDVKGSFAEFEKCVANNWEAALDTQLDSISRARENHLNKHPHHKNDSSAALVADDDEEDLTLITDVVNNVMTGNKNSSAIKIYDGGKSTFRPSNLASLPTLAPVAPGSSNQTKLMNDPDTLLVLVDNSKTTASPSKPSVAPAANSTLPTVAPLDVKINATQPSTSKPPTAAATATSTTTTAAPISSSTSVPTTTKSKQNSTVGPTTKSTTAKPAASSTHKPAAGSTTKPDHVSSTVKPTGAQHTSTTSAKPASALDELTKRQEKALKELQEKFKLEREQAKLHDKKKHVNEEAQNAIKSLAHQKQVSADKRRDENKLHQLEHQRQMSIDPIGHTIKHQQYEMKKKATDKSS